MKGRRARRPAPRPRDVVDAIKLQHENVIFELLITLVRAKESEEAYARFAPAARRRTETELQAVAKDAASFYVDNGGGSESMTLAETEKLLARSLEHALGTVLGS